LAIGLDAREYIPGSIHGESMNELIFEDRRDAGRQLAEHLNAYKCDPNAIVLALPRGGVPVAYEVARSLHLPLDVFVVRKLGLPGHPELAMGAIASGGHLYLNRDLIERSGTSPMAIELAIVSETKELERREQLYRREREPLRLRGRNVILIDDGLATGASMLAAVKAIEDCEPETIVAAVPVAAASSLEEVAGEVDEIVCVLVPRCFDSVGQWYVDFDQISDEEVAALLSECRI